NPNHLRRGQTSQRSQSQNISARVVADELDQKSHYRINQSVRENHLAAEFLFLVQPKQEEENDQHRERFVELRRMQFHARRNTGDFMPQLSEAHTPGQIRRLTPATTGGETSLASENVAQRYSRRARVRGLPPRQLPTAH